MCDYLKQVNQLAVDDKTRAIVKEALIKEGQINVVKFSSAKVQDCIDADRLGMKVENVDDQQATLHIPANFPTPVPGPELCSTLKKVYRVWKQARRQSLIDAILTEAVDIAIDKDSQLRGYCDVQIEWIGDHVIFEGILDYMIGYTSNDGRLNSRFLIVEAKKGWLPEASVWQTVSQAGCLMKNRLEAGKNTPVFAALSDGDHFRFFAVDTDMKVYCSQTIYIRRATNGFSSSDSLVEILRWFSWILEVCKSDLPAASQGDLSDKVVPTSLVQMRACFGRIESHSKRNLNGR
jgi:hypothetical protein